MLRATVVTSQGQGYERSQALGPESTECRAEKQGGSGGRLVGGGLPPASPPTAAMEPSCLYPVVLSGPVHFTVNTGTPLPVFLEHPEPVVAKRGFFSFF